MKKRIKKKTLKLTEVDHTSNVRKHFSQKIPADSFNSRQTIKKLFPFYLICQKTKQKKQQTEKK